MIHLTYSPNICCMNGALLLNGRIGTAYNDLCPMGLSVVEKIPLSEDAEALAGSSR